MCILTKQMYRVYIAIITTALMIQGGESSVLRSRWSFLLAGFSLMKTGECQVGCGQREDCRYDGCVNIDINGGCNCATWGVYYNRNYITYQNYGLDCYTCFIFSTGKYCPNRCPTSCNDLEYIGRINTVCQCNPCSPPCSMGTYESSACTLQANRVCSQCPANFYCPGNGSQPVPCPSDRQSFAGASNISQCLLKIQPGFYGILGTNGTRCELGNYCPGATTAPIPCAAGTYAPNYGMTACMECNYQTYSNAGASICTNCTTMSVCAAGSYLQQCNQCISCPANYYCINNQKIACPTPMISVAGSSSVSACVCYQPANSLMYNATTCEYVCKRTHSGPNCDVQEILYCNNNPGDCSESTCNGRCAGVTVRPFCQPISGVSMYCPPNYITSCPAGQFLYSQDACFPCYQNRSYFCAGGTSPVQLCNSDCVAGQYQVSYCSLTTNTICVPCPNSYYCPNVTTQLPCADICKKGFYQTTDCNSTTNRICQPCPESYFCTGNTSIQACTPFCVNGTYHISNCSSTSNRVCTNCTVCDPGYFEIEPCTAYTNRVCQPCPQGYVCPNSTTKIQCNLGSYCPTQTFSEAACLSKFYCPNPTVQLPCSKCKVGQYVANACNATSDVVCNTCGNEMYCPDAVNSFQCRAVCPTGTYETTACTTSTNRVCTNCSAPCSSGYYQTRACSGTVDSICTPCTNCGNAGELRPCTAYNDRTCNLQPCSRWEDCNYGACRGAPQMGCSCKDGAYWDTTPGRGWQYSLCPSNVPPNVCIYQGEILGSGVQGVICPKNCPLTCPADYRSNQYCECELCSSKCAVSEYESVGCSGTNDRVCTACPNGFYCNSTTKQSCSQCAKGTYIQSPCNATTECKQCPYEYFCNGFTHVQQCKPQCTNDTYAMINCNATNDRECVNCTQCGVGFFEDKPCTPLTNRECKACLAGYFCPNTTSQIQCKIGSYCPTGSTSEIACSSQFYCPNTTVQLPCPLGHFCLSGVSSPTMCPAGTFGNKTQLSACMNCTKFTYASDSGSSACTQCATAPRGMYRSGCEGTNPGTLAYCTNTP